MKSYKHTGMSIIIRTSILILLGVAAIVVAKYAATRPQGTTITQAQLTEALRTKNQSNGRQAFVFINVHTPYEGEIEHTDLVIPYDNIVSQSAVLPKDKHTPIILYCKTGHMSTIALATLRKMGYTNVRQLTGGMDAWTRSGGTLLNLSTLPSQVLPPEGVALPVSWGTRIKQLVDAGVIYLPALSKTMQLTPEQEGILTRGSTESIRIDRQNSQFVVDVLWALGLAQKSIVYDEGPMGTQYKKDAGNFASTGGWNLARGDAMQYLNRFDLIRLSAEEQQHVGEIAKHIYRPCCDNPTWFPDCNHGMAALAMIELMVSARVDDATIYKKVLGFNSFWFPDSYLAIATYFARQGMSWNSLDAKELLGAKYSTATGASKISSMVGPLPYANPTGGSCGT